MTRVLGGTIAPNGIPLTTTGWRRAQQWRQEWLDLPGHVVPYIIGPTGMARPGVDGLAYLAELLASPAGHGERTIAAEKTALSPLG